MRVSEELLEQAEEFFDLIPCSDDDVELNSAMDCLRCFLETDVGGWAGYSRGELADGVQSRLEEIWELVSSDARADADLQEYFQDFIESLDEMARVEDEPTEWDAK